MKADQIGVSVSPIRGRGKSVREGGEGLSHPAGLHVPSCGPPAVVEVKLPN